MERKTVLLGLLKQAHEMEMDFVDALSDPERARIGTLENWSARDIISHNAAWNARMADNLLAVSEGRAPSRPEDIDGENARLFEEHRDKTWDQVLSTAMGAFQRVVAQVDSLGEQELASVGRFPWRAKWPLWRLVVGTACIHQVAHLAEFYRNQGNREQAGKLMGEMARSMVGLDDSSLWQGEVKYTLACHYSLLGVAAKAIQELRESLALNPGLTEWSKQDPDLDAIRDEPECQAIYES